MPHLTPRPSGTPPYWEPGTRIVWRYGEPDAPHFAGTLTVVRDDADGLVAWLARDTPMLVVERADGRPGRSDPATMFTAERVQGTARWQGYDVLRVAPTGRAWSVWVFFTPEGEHVGWYVNLEDPHRRDAGTVYSSDHVLDLWVEPDRTRERKDEDELVLALEQGRYTEEEVRRIERAAREAEAVIDAWGPPFCDGWEDFRPDPRWGVPELPPDAH
ncbi:DUF402 domain-containing protein [Nocardioides sp. Soil805]|uniref:DUF402 domain-containing protein n=1 Tax=Nocardioides sp. Soil805 TaxID=1736416 RepID=UPI0007032538|nr:DUF402 domain-containing protein [Nocardioides sp. Soil805]KRF35371.1 hypothetical protein ASG94_14840 [Nocardioides sp. Soil805]